MSRFPESSAFQQEQEYLDREQTKRLGDQPRRTVRSTLGIRQASIEKDAAQQRVLADLDNLIEDLGYVYHPLDFSVETHREELRQIRDVLARTLS
jgi:hypothetical protein